MRDLVMLLTAVVVSLYSVAALMGIASGIGRAGKASNDCNEPWTRIEYVLPAYRIGCWLGEVPGQKENK